MMYDKRNIRVDGMTLEFASDVGFRIKQKGGFNMINKIANILDIKVDEEFAANNGKKYKLTQDGVLLRVCHGKYVLANYDLNALITGEIKPVIKPKLNEMYYTISIILNEVVDMIWKDDYIDNILLKRGLIFKTKEDAQGILDKILALTGGVAK